MSEIILGSQNNDESEEKPIVEKPEEPVATPRPEHLNTWPDPLPAYPTIGIDPTAMFVFVGIVLATIVLILFLWRVRSVMMVLFLGVILAESIRPSVRWLARRGLPVPAAVAIPYLIILGTVAGIGAIVVPILSSEVIAFGEQLPGLISWGQSETVRMLQLTGNPDLVNNLQQASGQLTERLVALTEFLVRLPITIAEVVIAITATLVISIYWLSLAPAALDEIFSIIPIAHRDRVWEALEEMGGRVGGYVRGTFVLALAIGVLVYPGLVALDVRYPLILAAVAAFFELVPFIGPVLGAVPGVIVALIDSPTKAALAIVLYVVVQQIEAHLLAPNIMGKAVGVAPLIVILALLSGSTIGGVVGAIVAIPAAAVAQVVVTQAILPVLQDRARRPRPTPEDKGAHVP
ncbi:MAG TPA: AI-2E family transporter [Chloroflexota bacterium]|nr:AI-2E family transporter [Chloroflexota bacterium]